MPQGLSSAIPNYGSQQAFPAEVKEAVVSRNAAYSVNGIEFIRRGIHHNGNTPLSW